MKDPRWVLIAAAIGLAAGGAALAQGAGPPGPVSAAPLQQMLNVCQPDADRLCPGKSAARCLEENEVRLSPPCRQSRQKIYDADPDFVAMAKACEADNAKYCKGVEGVKLGGCMQQNEAKLSQACNQARARLNRPDPQLEAMVQACKADTAQYCSGKESHALGDCLEDNQAKLSTACNQARARVEAATAGMSSIKP